MIVSPTCHALDSPSYKEGISSPLVMPETVVNGKSNIYKEQHAERGQVVDYQVCNQVPALPLTSCMVLRIGPYHFEDHFSHL